VRYLARSYDAAFSLSSQPNFGILPELALFSTNSFLRALGLVEAAADS
jgi:hypothetical protein